MGDPKLSDQELKDDIDQLLTHVDAESRNELSQITTSNSTVQNGESRTDGDPQSTLNGNNSEVASSKTSSGQGDSSKRSGGGADTNAPGTHGHTAANSTTLATTDVDGRLTAEESFDAAQKRMELFARNETVDENDVRTLQALSLQATRGDCDESQSGSLFKTDLEAATDMDIGHNDPLWGAWCMFRGVYKSDAMRDYVTKQRSLEDRITALYERIQSGDNETLSSDFDPNASSLDDVMSPEDQSSLVARTEMISPHLRDTEIRYLAALSLQATFGDCGPYASKSSTSIRDGTTEERKLIEPLLGQTATRRQGAQWGAWCVLQGKKRSTAALDLSNQIGVLHSQLASKLSASADAQGFQDPVERKLDVEADFGSDATSKVSDSGHRHTGELQESYKAVLRELVVKEVYERFVYVFKLI